MDKTEAFLAIASILSGFGITVFMFRIQRELDVRERTRDVATWLAWADYLVLAAITLALMFVVLPLVVAQSVVEAVLAVAAAACAAAAILLAAYPWAILYHYRIVLGTKRRGQRLSGEPGEKCVVIAAAIFAIIVSLVILRTHITPPS
jgi:hypothetical protein